jgi:hypothetical protein
MAGLLAGAMRSMPTAAVEVLLRLPPLHLKLGAEAQEEFTDSIAVDNGSPNL